MTKTSSGLDSSPDVADWQSLAAHTVLVNRISNPGGETNFVVQFWNASKHGSSCKPGWHDTHLMETTEASGLTALDTQNRKNPKDRFRLLRRVETVVKVTGPPLSP